MCDFLDTGIIFQNPTDWKKSLWDLCYFPSERRNPIFSERFKNILAWDYDAITEAVCKPIRNDSLTSADALFPCSNGDWIFIEFKLRKGCDIETHENELLCLRKKMYESLLTSEPIFFHDLPFDEIRKRLHFIFVYEDDNDDTPSIGNIRKALGVQAGIPNDKEQDIQIRFGLEKFQGPYYASVHTWTEKEFDKHAPKFLGLEATG